MEFCDSVHGMVSSCNMALRDAVTWQHVKLPYH